MAENKNGFVLYKDLINVVRKLVLKDRENKTNYGGELFLLILEYVNDENPVPIDFILEMTFEPVKAQLKRDLKKYETKINKNSESGRIGNLKRWHPDLFQQYEKGSITLINAEEIAEGRKRDKSIAKVADTDTVTDSDIDSDTDILLEKETKRGELFNIDAEHAKPPNPVTSKKVAQKKVSFKPPDPSEVESYCIERQNGIKGQEFCDFYSSKGWMVGKNKMKDWKASVRTWENSRKNGFTNNTKPSTGKISGHQFIAGKLRELSARDSESGDNTIDIEAFEVK